MEKFSENFENKRSSPENFITTIERDGPKEPQNTKEWIEKVKQIQAEQLKLRSQMENEIVEMNQVRASLGLSPNDSSPSIEYYIKPKLNRLNEEYSVASEKILADRSISYEQIMHSVPTMKVPWEERVKKVHNDSNLIARNAVDRIHAGGMEMSDGEWQQKVTENKTEKETFYQNLDAERQDIEKYFNTLQEKNNAPYEDKTTQEDINKLTDEISAPAGYKTRSEYEKAQDERWKKYDEDVRLGKAN